MSVAQTSLCHEWGPPTEQGILDQKLIPESSGLALSQLWPNRFYHINDSGDGPFFYSSDLIAENTKKIKIDHFKPTDTEELNLAPCPDDNGTCLYIADIGDNDRKRKNIKIAIIREEEFFKSPVSPLNILTIIYPDKPSDSEAFFIHPNGDLYLFTKEINSATLKSSSAKLYKINKKELLSNSDIILKKVSEIDLPYALPNDSVGGQIVTASTISNDGKKFALMTYENIIEFNFDLSKNENFNMKDLIANKDYNVISTELIGPQTEALTYGMNDHTIYFTSETLNQSNPGLFKIECLIK